MTWPFLPTACRKAFFLPTAYSLGRANGHTTVFLFSYQSVEPGTERKGPRQEKPPIWTAVAKAKADDTALALGGGNGKNLKSQE
ncbi:MAG: hypothetical protein AMXMBFR84_32630 [Candidatus Hydrogenedentota bacterium]